MKPSGQPRLGPATIGGLTGGPIIGIALTLFAIITFPPLGAFVGIVVGLVLSSKWLDRRHRRRSERSHRTKMDDWYRERAAAERTFVNPGWRL